MNMDFTKVFYNIRDTRQGYPSWVHFVKQKMTEKENFSELVVISAVADLDKMLTGF